MFVCVYIGFIKWHSHTLYMFYLPLQQVLCSCYQLSINYLVMTGSYKYTGLLKMIVGVATTCHTQYTSFSRCNPMWFLSMGLRQGSGLCSSSSRKYPGTEGCYMLQFGTNSIIVLMFVESQRCTYRAPIRYVTKTWSVVLLNKKDTYTPISSVLCMTSC